MTETINHCRDVYSAMDDVELSYNEGWKDYNRTSKFMVCLFWVVSWGFLLRVLCESMFCCWDRVFWEVFFGFLRGGKGG